MRELGHYAIGLRDGGSEWHVGTNVHRQCDQGCREEVEAPERALSAAREAVKGLQSTGRAGVATGGNEETVVWATVEYVSRAAVMRILGEPQ